MSSPNYIPEEPTGIDSVDEESGFQADFPVPDVSGSPLQLSAGTDLGLPVDYNIGIGNISRSLIYSLFSVFIVFPSSI